jgi:polyferredoxin
MTRLERPVGLIRHTSATAVAGTRQARFTLRAAGYAFVWLALVGTAGRLLATRADLDVLILRQPGSLYASLPEGDVANFYTIQALNRTAAPAGFVLEVLEPRGAVATTLGPISPVDAYAVRDGRFLIRAPLAALRGASTPVRVRVTAPGHDTLILESSFLGPNSGR